MSVEDSNMVQDWSTHTTMSLIEGLDKGLWDRILEYPESKLDKYCIQENIRPCFIFTHFAHHVGGQILLFIVLEHYTIMSGQILKTR